MLEKRLETTVEHYNQLVKNSIIKGDPKTYVAFLLGQTEAYEKILKEIYKKQTKSKGIQGTRGL